MTRLPVDRASRSRALRSRFKDRTRNGSLHHSQRWSPQHQAQGGLRRRTRCEGWRPCARSGRPEHRPHARREPSLAPRAGERGDYAAWRRTGLRSSRSPSSRTNLPQPGPSSPAARARRSIRTRCARNSPASTLASAAERSRPRPGPGWGSSPTRSRSALWRLIRPPSWHSAVSGRAWCGAFSGCPPGRSRFPPSFGFAMLPLLQGASSDG